MEVGKLYKTKDRYWMLYPSKDTAALLPGATAAYVAIARSAATVDATAADNWANYWSEQLNCNVSYVETNSMFVLLEQTERFCKVLSTEGKVGWIIYPENEAWTKNCIEEVKEIS
jgi:hypothetical protein